MSLDLLNDPLQAFVKNSSEEANVDVTKLEDHQIFLWRQGKEHSFSDWTIELFPGNADCPAAGDCQPDEERIFYVHRCILANSSTYFRSLFSGQTVEQSTKTSTIRLHSRAIQAFPVFLDCIYNHEQGRLNFCREDAVALRHLSMYFGVDMLLQDITDIIMKDFKNKESRESFRSDAIIFSDKMLLEAIKIQSTRQESCKLVAPALFKNLESNPSKYLQNDNDVILAWKHVMANADISQDIFFVSKNVCKFPNLCITNAGLKMVNGLYKVVGGGDNLALYTNGVCFLFTTPSSTLWRIIIGFMHADKQNWSLRDLYSISSNTDQPPSTGWLVDYQPRTEKDPGPTITVSLIRKKYID